MEDNVWRPAHLTPEQMEERRLEAARLLRQGLLSQAEIARQLGVSRASVCRWAATLAQEGPRGLERARFQDSCLALMRGPGFAWGGSSTGAR
jgi:transposase-like protein